MNGVSTKLADSLRALKAIQDSDQVAIKTEQLSRDDRERLSKHGFIKQVLRGWYISSDPSEREGDSTSWYTSFWRFCSEYLDSRLDEQWCLSPEQSLSIHVGDRTVPVQLLVRSPNGRNKPTNLLFDTSVFDIKQTLPVPEHMTSIDGVRVLTLSAALINCSKKAFEQHPVNVKAALSSISDASDLLAILIAEGRTTIAGRLAGAFRNIGRDSIADAILNGMAAADYKVKEQDPFQAKDIVFARRDLSPYANRMKIMWAQMREQVIANYPGQPSLTTSVESYLASVDEVFVTDAYHSLSIEGYKVSPELIELVSSGNWDPDDTTTKAHTNAMAAKGYWNAFQKVKASIEQVLNGKNSGEELERIHGAWYLALFEPSVAAGLLTATDLAGYRTGPVYIKGSKHVPPSRDAIRDMMPTLFDLLIEEESPAVRAILGHFMFVYIHPYFDGNGRMGRFIMNLMFASGGHPWHVVPVERREEYMQALEVASVSGDIVPFTEFIESIR